MRGRCLFLLCATLLACARSPTDGGANPIDGRRQPVDPAPVRPYADYRLYFDSNREGDPIGWSMKEIFSVRADGSGLRQITDNGVDVNVPAFTIAPDGGTIAYEGEYEPGCGRRPGSRPCGPGEQPSYAVDIVLIGTDGTGRRNLTNGIVTHPAPNLAILSDPQWSPDGNTLAYAALLPDGWSIHTLDPNNAADLPLTTSPLSWKPRWSPSGEHIAFLRLGAGNTWQMAIMPAGGGSPSIVTPLPNGSGAAWSPDGAEMALSILGTAGTWHVEVIGTDGRGRRSISGELINAANPYWDPAGRRIVFQAESNGGLAIFRVDLPDGPPQLLTAFPHGYRAEVPVIAPDGGIVSFVARPPGGRYEAWVVRIDGSDLRQVTGIGPVSQVAFDPRVPAQ